MGNWEERGEGGSIKAIVFTVTNSIDIGPVF